MSLNDCRAGLNQEYEIGFDILNERLTISTELDFEFRSSSEVDIRISRDSKFNSFEYRYKRLRKIKR